MKSMHMRDFLRGGYKDITETTQITKHGRPVATWLPYGEADTGVYKIKRLGRQPARLPIEEKANDSWQPLPGERVAWEE